MFPVPEHLIFFMRCICLSLNISEEISPGPCSRRHTFLDQVRGSSHSVIHDFLILNPCTTSGLLRPWMEYCTIASMVLHFFQSIMHHACLFRSPNVATNSGSTSTPDHSCWVVGNSVSFAQSLTLDPSTMYPFSTMDLISWLFCTCLDKSRGLVPC
jgi:hypothetical protein